MASIRKMSVPFTQVANSVINDPNISFKAKGIYAYIYSKPDGWDFAIRRMASDTKESRDAVEAGVKELELAGYLVREKKPNGRMIYFVLYPPAEPSTENTEQAIKEPSTENPNLVKPHLGVSRTISNKELKKEIVISKKDSDVPSQDIALVIKAFEKINQACDSFYGNKTQREAVSKLIEYQGLDRVLKIIETVLPRSNSMMYAPVITTPMQLLQKYSALEAFIVKQKSKQQVGKLVNGVMV